jgi:hypothetical protein
MLLMLAIVTLSGSFIIYGESGTGVSKLGHWVGLVVGVLVEVGYVNVVIDQLPCFLGVPKCD